MDRIVKRRTNLLYNLRKKGIRCLTKERVIFFPYGDQEPLKVKQIAALCNDYNFHVQLELLFFIACHVAIISHKKK